MEVTPSVLVAWSVVVTPAGPSYELGLLYHFPVHLSIEWMYYLLT